MNNANLDKMMEEMSHEDFERFSQEMDKFPSLIIDNVMRNLELVVKYEEFRNEYELQAYAEDFARTILELKDNAPMTFRMMVQNGEKKELELWSMSISGQLDELKEALKKYSQNARETYELKAKITGDNLSYHQALKDAISEIKEKANG